MNNQKKLHPFALNHLIFLKPKFYNICFDQPEDLLDQPEDLTNLLQFLKKERERDTNKV